MADGKSFKDQISPFVWVEDKESASVVLGATGICRTYLMRKTLKEAVTTGRDWQGFFWMRNVRT